MLHHMVKRNIQLVGYLNHSIKPSIYFLLV